MSKPTALQDEETQLALELEALEAAAGARKLEQEKAARVQRMRDRKALLEAEASGLRVSAIWHESGLVIVRAPTKAEYTLWRKTQLEEDATGRRDMAEAKAIAMDTMGRNCVHSPPKAEFAARLAVYPGLQDLVTKAAVILAEGRVEDLGK